MFSKLFGSNYANKVDIFQSLYARILFLRGGCFDFPIFIFICFLIPWDYFYKYAVVQHLINFMVSNVRNISENKVNSDFPIYAVTYLSIIHFVGILSLILPFIFCKKSKLFYEHIKRIKVNQLKIIIFGFIAVFIFTFGHMFSGAISYFGCNDCSYHHKLSLIAGAIVPWICANYFLAITVIAINNFIFYKPIDE